MANNFENVNSNQNGMITSGFFGFPTWSGDVAINPYPTVLQNNKDQNNLFVSDSQENHESHEKFDDDLTITQPLIIQPKDVMPSNPFIKDPVEFSTRFGDQTLAPRFDDLSITHHTVQQNDSKDITSHAGITFTYPLSGQNMVPFMNDNPQIWSNTNHVGSSSQVNQKIQKKTKHDSKVRVRSANRVNKSSSRTQSKKRVRFSFDRWTDEEQKVMDRELKKYTSLPVMMICIKIAGLLSKKSIRDVGMRIQWFIKNRKLDNINWFWKEPTPEGDLSDFNFYMPDNPNDPDLLAIQDKFGARAIRHKSS